MHDRIKALKKENNELRKHVTTLEQNENTIIEDDKVKRDREEEEHQANRKDFRDQISVTKVELDKVMSRPL